MASERKVKFQSAVIVHKLITWNFASRQSRKGQWMQFAIDRERFQRKITMCHEPILQLVTDKNHRQKIYTERFSSCISSNSIK